MDIIVPKYKVQHVLKAIIEHCILAVAFFLPLSVDLATFFLVVGAVGWLGKMLLNRRIAFQCSRLDLAVGLFVVLSYLSIAGSPDPNFSSYNYHHLMGRYIVLYYLVVNNVHSLEQLKRLIWSMLASAAVVTLYGFYQYMSGMDISTLDWVDGNQFPELKVRVFSTLQNPNLLAGFLVMMMALTCGLACKARLLTMRILFAVMFIAHGICLGLTYSRGAWVSVAFVIGLYGMVHNRKILWLLLLLPVGLFLGQDVFTERAMSIFNPVDTSSTLRVALWESTLAMIVDKPLLGIGWGAYWLVYPQYDFFIQNAATTIFHAHNMYLNIAAEIGIPGLLAFLWILFGHMYKAWSLLPAAIHPWTGGLLLGLIAALAGLAVSGFTDFIMFNIQISMLFWLVNGLIVVVWKLHCRQAHLYVGRRTLD